MCCAKNINFSLESSVLSQSQLRIGGGGVPIHMVRKQNAQEIVRGTSNCRLRILRAKRGFFKKARVAFRDVLDLKLLVS